MTADGALDDEGGGGAASAHCGRPGVVHFCRPAYCEPNALISEYVALTRASFG